MVRLIARIVPGMAVAAAAATITVIGLRTFIRYREQREWAKAWDVYRHTRDAR